MLSFNITEYVRGQIAIDANKFSLPTEEFTDDESLRDYACEGVNGMTTKQAIETLEKGQDHPQCFDALKDALIGLREDIEEKQSNIATTPIRGKWGQDEDMKEYFLTTGGEYFSWDEEYERWESAWRALENPTLFLEIKE